MGDWLHEICRLADGSPANTKEPDPTDAELDEIAAYCDYTTGRLIKALRACRQRVTTTEGELRDCAHAIAEIGCNPLEPLAPQITKRNEELTAMRERYETLDQRSKAKDAVVEAMSHRNQGIGAQPFGKEWRVEIYFPTKAEACALLDALAALDKGTDDADGS